MEELDAIAKLADSQLAKRAYEDMCSQPAQEVGKLATDSLKTFRLLMAPFQLLAAAQDRFARWLDEVRNRVPPERQVDAAPEIAGPVLLNLRFLSDENELRHLYLNLLTLAIDRDNRQRAHPGFIRVIEQMSPQDAVFLEALARRAPLHKRLEVNTPSAAVVVVQRECAAVTCCSINELQRSLDLLRGLAILDFHAMSVIAGPGANSYDEANVWLTQFGKDFVAACLPGQQ